MEAEEKGRRTGDILRYLGAILLIGDWNAGGIPFAFFSSQDENWEELAMGVSLGHFDFAEIYNLPMVFLGHEVDARAAAKLADSMWTRHYKAAQQNSTVCVGVVLAPDADEGYVKVVVRDYSGTILYQTTDYVSIEEDEKAKEIGKNRITLAPDIVSTVFDSLNDYVEELQKDTQGRED